MIILRAFKNASLLRTILVVSLALTLTACAGLLMSWEKKNLNPGVKSQRTPADVGLKFARASIPSGTRRLDGFLVRAPVTCRPPEAALLIFHGRGETVADWVGAQKYLHDRCVSSLIFGYSGHGHSSAGGTVGHLNEDAVAADQFFMRGFIDVRRRCFMSHSMGAGPLLYAATRNQSEPDCIVLASPSSSFRAMAIEGGMPRALEFMMPDVWNNRQAVEALRVPLLWVHSSSDTTIPLASGRAVYDAKAGTKSAAILGGYAHNAIYNRTPDAIWSPIISFVRKGG